MKIFFTVFLFFISFFTTVAYAFDHTVLNGTWENAHAVISIDFSKNTYKANIMGGETVKKLELVSATKDEVQFTTGGNPATAKIIDKDTITISRPGRGHMALTFTRTKDTPKN